MKDIYHKSSQTFLQMFGIDADTNRISSLLIVLILISLVSLSFHNPYNLSLSPQSVMSNLLQLSISISPHNHSPLSPYKSLSGAKSR